jgi:hypothetical protein
VFWVIYIYIYIYIEREREREREGGREREREIHRQVAHTYFLAVFANPLDIFH